MKNSGGETPDGSTIIWFVRVDDETRVPGPRLVSREAMLERDAGYESIRRILPDGSFLHPCEEVGTVGVEIPKSEIECFFEVYAAFVAAGYKIDPKQPRPSI